MPTTAPPPRVNVEVKAAIEALLADRPVAYHPVIARAVGSVTAGVLLAQFLYWAPRSQDEAGWFYKTREEIAAETALSRSEQETARKKLVGIGVLEEQLRKVPAKMHYRLDLDRLAALLAQQADVPPSSGGAGDQQVGGNPANWPAAIPPTNTETTAETTDREVKPSNIRGAFSRVGGTDRGALTGHGSEVVRHALVAKGLLPPETPAPAAQLPPPSGRLRPARRQGPPPEYIAVVIADIVREFGEPDNTPVNVREAMALWHASGVSVQAFVDLVYETQAVVRSRRSIRNRLGFFFTCLRRALPAATGGDAPLKPPTGPKAADMATVEEIIDSRTSGRFGGASGPLATEDSS